MFNGLFQFEKKMDPTLLDSNLENKDAMFNQLLMQAVSWWCDSKSNILSADKMSNGFEQFLLL